MSRESKMLRAIEAVYRARGEDFFRFALARTMDPERARDAVQEGFARAIRAADSFRGSGSLEAWIGRCVLNAAIDAGRRVGGPEFDEQLDGDVSPSIETRNGDVRDALRRLPVRQRDALFLRYYLDFDYATIA